MRRGGSDGWPGGPFAGRLAGQRRASGFLAYASGIQCMSGVADALVAFVGGKSGPWRTSARGVGKMGPNSEGVLQCCPRSVAGSDRQWRDQVLDLGGPQCHRHEQARRSQSLRSRAGRTEARPAWDLKHRLLRGRWCRRHQGYSSTPV